MKKASIYLVYLFSCLVLLTGCCRHEWLEADCVNPKTCAKCGEIEGAALGHTPGEVCQTTDIVNAQMITERYCEICGAKISEEKMPISSFISTDQATFLFTPNEYLERLMNLAETDYPSISYAIDENGTVEIDRGVDDGKTIQFIFYHPDSTPLLETEYDEAVVFCVSVTACGTAEEVGQAFDSDFIYAVAYATDPSFTKDSLQELLEKKYDALLDAYLYNEEWSYWINNDMLYQFGHGVLSISEMDISMGFDMMLIYAVDQLDSY